MRVLITGIGGFVGRHLAAHLTAAHPEQSLFGTVLHAPTPGVPGSITLHTVDLRDSEQVRAVIATVQPDQIYHMAAQASPAWSHKFPWETLENNIRAQLNLITACLAENIRPRFLVISSGEIYGAAPAESLPSREDAPLLPASPYSVSKITQEMLGLQYFISHQLPILRVRPFNHIGPGQSEGFVAPDFAMQIARIEAGLQAPTMMVGNLNAERDFTDVRDVVQAYALLMERGTPGDVYNIASGHIYSIQNLLDLLLTNAKTAIQVREDPEKMRPASIPLLCGNAAKLQTTTGWHAGIPFEQTLLDVLNDCRQRIESTAK